MTDDFKGNYQGRELKIGIVVARFNEFVTARLLEGARRALADGGVQDLAVKVVWVPGSFDIPLVAKLMADSQIYDAIVCLGAVIRGDTDHYEYVSRSVSSGIANAGFESGVPVIFGILTTDTVDQALDRSGGRDGSSIMVPRDESKSELIDEVTNGGVGNSGYNAGLAAIEMANLIKNL